MRNRPLLVTGVALVVLVGARIALGIVLWEPGWSTLGWDDYIRVSMALEWALDPFLTPGLVWLPLQTWIYGIGYNVFGGLATDNPMLLPVFLNTIAIVLAAGLVAWSAWRLFRSHLGALIAFAAAAFAPWSVFVSLSAFNEAFYYLAVSAAVASLITWMEGGSLVALALGAFAVAAGAGLRYDGWVLAGAWLVAVTVWELRLFPRLTGRSREAGQSPYRLAGHVIPLAIASVPLLVPVWHVLLNVHRVGDPLYFARESARLFRLAHGGMSDWLDRHTGRIFFYPGALVRSAPLLLPGVLLLVAMTARPRPQVRVLAGMVLLAFGVFVGPSLVTGSVGAFPERFMFPFVLALMPVLGSIPALLGRLRRAVLWPVAGVLLLGTIGVTAYRIDDRPQEWTHAPDLIELASTLGEATADGGTLALGLGPGLDPEALPLRIQNGPRVQVHRFPTADPAEAPDWIDIWIERFPDRIAATTAQPDAVVGRYHLYGEAAAGLPIDTARCDCAGWVRITEDGTVTPVPAGPYMALEFVTSDPEPSARAVLRRAYARGAEPVAQSHRVRWLYGHGFNRGRIRLEATIDGQLLFDTDIAESNRWVEVEYTIPAGTGESIVEIALVAQDGIEWGWEWGRASTVLVASGEAAR